MDNNLIHIPLPLESCDVSFPRKVLPPPIVPIKFVLDVSTREHRRRHGNQNAWYAADGGFWKPGPHLVLTDGFDYPEQSIWLDQYIVIEADGKISVYRNWFQDYVPDTITAELLQGGFVVQSLWGDLAGAPYTTDSEWIGLVAARK